MIYFISDQHLGLGERTADKQRERDLLQFLSLAKPHCERLFVLGDLFDYWFEYETVVPKYHVRTLAALADYADSGIAVDYLMGNHDFGHQTFFEEELGITIHKGDLALALHNKRFYLAHGDGKAFNDTGYLLLRTVLRHPLALWAWKWLHPDVGVGIAARASRKSRAYTSEKQFGNERNGLEAFAEEKIKEGCDFVLMGHLHKPVEKRFEHETGSGLYINTGDWLNHRTYAEFDGTTLSLRRLDDFLQR
ncbi:MAG: UDP-2,3-diacylglucosamine diphosphatase [Candidatus Kapaibacteriota bacterium]|jgi:UDP-2,3-diacylglucosamine hydrolase